MTVAFAVLVSLFVSFTLDPMLSSHWHDPAIASKGQRRGLARLLERFNAGFERTAGGYGRIIGWALDHRKTVVAVATAAFVGGLAMFVSLESSFFPKSDNGEFRVSFKTSPDASLGESRNRLADMIGAIRDIPEVGHTYASIGAGDEGSVRSGYLYVKLKPRKERKRSQQDVQQEFRHRLARIPGVITSLEEVDNLTGNQKPLIANIRGADMTLLKTYASRLRDEMDRTRGIKDVEVSLEHDIPEYRLTVDRERAQSAGLMTDAIVRNIGALVGGEIVSTYEDEDGDAVDVRVRLPEALRESPEQIKHLEIPVIGGKGAPVVLPLANFISYDAHATPLEINRQDLIRQVSISANLDDLALSAAIEQVQKAAGKMNMEPGYSVVFTGESADMDESFAYIAEALILAVLFVYFILAAQFESFVDPLAIILSLPLSIIGMAGMLYLTGDTLNIMSLIGLIMLMGLVTKNAILLVDCAKTLRQEGRDRREAVISAGRMRLRPIIMTTLAMIFGMLPLALALGAGAEMRAPMARGVIGGLLTSTLLTLIVVPVAYTLLDDLRRRKGGRFLLRHYRATR
ncbi:MAG TPA: efflux RND transporter permease subunit, partial [Smithellaceae bacterium]|nr:efflux RND transporter permease subunit [Smithellaceae bacterium]